MSQAKVDRQTIVTALEEIALLLELSGATTFRVVAYQNGARAVQDFDGDLFEALESGELAKVHGIGKSLLEQIEALLRTGESPALLRLRDEVPAGMRELVKIPGLGPKKARKLYEALGVESLSELEQACSENRVAKLPGYGAKSQENILEGIRYARRREGRFLMPMVWGVADDLCRRVEALEGVQRAEVAGSIRRRKEIVKDVDILVATDDAENVTQQFLEFPEIDRVLGSGDTKTSVILRRGIQVDVRFVTPTQFPFALHYFTGSKEHNTAVRARAKLRDLKLNEYGLFPAGSDESLECEDEAAIFAAVDLPYVPPELREDRGEFDAPMPALLEESDLRGALHNHSGWSDGADGVKEMAEAARELGWEYIGLSDHGPAVGYGNCLTADDVRRQHEEIDAINGEMTGFTVLKGVECDILEDGSLDFPDEILEQFEFVIASIHAHRDLPRAKQTARVIRALRHPLVSVLGHPRDRLLLGRQGIDVDMDEVLGVAGATGTFIELNAKPVRLDLDWRDLHAALRKGVSLSISPDAHRVTSLGDVRFGVAVARKGWVTAADVINTRPLDELRALLIKKRTS